MSFFFSLIGFISGVEGGSQTECLLSNSSGLFFHLDCFLESTRGICKIYFDST